MPAAKPKAVDEKHDGSNRSYLITLSSQLIHLDQDNFQEWQFSLVAVQYFARWDPEILDIDGTSGAASWDGTEETDVKTAGDRRNAYSVMRMRIKEVLHYLLEDIMPGDARALFARLKKRYCSMTTGAISALTTTVNNLSMENTGLSVEPFGYKVQTKFKHLLVVTNRAAGPSSQVEMVSIFLKGLLSPEFDTIKLYISMMKVSLKQNYLDIVQAVINFAQDQGYMALTRGKGARVMLIRDPPTRDANKNKKDMLCRFFKRGSCKKGNACDYSHAKQRSTDTLDERKEGGSGIKKKFPKGSCYHCGDKAHMRPACPILKLEK
jgi:hypothetical protein